MHLEQTIDQLTSRHIARCLDYLGETLAPVQGAAIKRSFRFLADDIKDLIKHGEHTDEIDGIQRKNESAAGETAGAGGKQASLAF
jgi:hypothetical protein